MIRLVLLLVMLHQRVQAGLLYNNIFKESFKIIIIS